MTYETKGLCAWLVGLLSFGLLIGKEALAQSDTHAAPPATANAVVAVLTLPQGDITHQSNGQSASVGPFTPLANGDQLTLKNGAKMTLLYPKSGRIEVWHGSGQLRIGVQSGQASGLSPPMIGQMPANAAQQIARTPSDFPQLAFAPRTRSLVVEVPANIDETYLRLRRGAPPDDLNPEMYLLSALFERRDFARVEQVLAELKARQPSNPEVGMLASLYGKALRNARRQ